MLANFTVGADPNSGDDIAALCFALGVKSEADYGYASGTSTTLLIGDVFKEIGFVSANEIKDEIRMFSCRSFKSFQTAVHCKKNFVHLIVSLDLQAVIGNITAELFQFQHGVQKMCQFITIYHFSPSVFLNIFYYGCNIN
jgi:hypothetical protein